MRAFLTFLCCWGLAAEALSEGSDLWNAGPLYDRFDLTLAPGHRTEALGPLFYSEEKETQWTWATPPLFSYTQDPGTESKEYDVLYPLLSYDRYGEQYRWHFLQILSWAGGPTQTESFRDRFDLFPLYFQQRSSDPSQDYTAVFPIYGDIKNRLFRDDIFFILFPCYSQTRKKDVVTDNYLYPFFHLRHGNGLSGWQLWPLAGHEQKVPTTQTNGFNEVQTIGGHEEGFVLWPFFLNRHDGIGTENPQWEQASMPAYNFLRSPRRDTTTILWPFFTWIDDREKKYREWQLPWPIYVKARGPGKTSTRIWPFFGHAHDAELESDFYLWPVYKYNRVHSEPLDRERTRIFFFLYSDTVQKNTDTGKSLRRIDLWPLFTHRKDYNGNTRLQILAPLEPYLPNNKSIERNYSPLWSVWRSERNARTGASSQSLLWNLYRHESTAESKRTSLLFGLFQQQSTQAGGRVRLFYIPFGKAPARSGAQASLRDSDAK